MTRGPVHNSAMTEADTCRDFVTPKIVQAGWSDAPFATGEQRSFTNGRIFVAGGKVRRGKQRRADYILFYRRDFPLAVANASQKAKLQDRLRATRAEQQAHEQAAKSAQTEGDALYWPIFNLDLKNPSAKAGPAHTDPKDLIAAMRGHEAEVMRLLGEIEALVNEVQA